VHAVEALLGSLVRGHVAGDESDAAVQVGREALLEGR
jgi:hypothetical protein